MTARILEGKTPADAILKKLKRDVATFSPRLAIVQIGNHPSSDAYIARKLAACAKIELPAEHVRLNAKATADAAITCLQELSASPEITGIILQLPLPAQLQKHQRQLLDAISPTKDVDGLTSQNIGLLVAGDQSGLQPATPTGILKLLGHYKIDQAGKRVVMVGRSLLVGQTLATLLTQRDATVTLCHSRTPSLARFTKEADIVICAVGKPGLIKPAMLKKGAVGIDVGITREKSGIKGDFSPKCAAVASALTPVPGGVGPLTVACLLQNCLLAAKRQRSS